MSRKNNETYDYLMHSASSSDQTGLIPSGITSDAEKESYQNLYPYPTPMVKQDDGQALNSTQPEESGRPSRKRKINGHLSEAEEKNVHQTR